MVSEVTSKKMWSSNLLRVGCSTRWWLMTHLTLWWQRSNKMTILLTMKKVDILQEWDVRMVQIIIMILQEISSPQNFYDCIGIFRWHFLQEISLPQNFYDCIGIFRWHFFAGNFLATEWFWLYWNFLQTIFLQEISSPQNGTVGLSGGQAVVFLMKILWAFVQHIFNWLELSTDGQRSSCHKQSKVNTTKEMSKLFPFSVFGLLSLALLVAPWPSWPSMSGKEGRLGTCAWWTNV